MRTKRIAAGWDYLDGTMGLSVLPVESFNSHYRAVPVEMLQRLNAAHEAVDAIEQEIMSIPEQENPKYKEDA